MFFLKGWGDINVYECFFEVCKIVIDREKCYKLIFLSYLVELNKLWMKELFYIVEGYFMLFLVRYFFDLLFKESEKVYF